MTKRLIGPPHAHQDGPCSDLCYEDAPAPSVDVTSHDDRTLDKVRAGIRSFFADGEAITGLISSIQTQGVLFRERTTDTDNVSDGYHTFGELYDHRRALTATLAVTMNLLAPGSAWRSKAHHPDDGPMFDGGYFIVGIEVPTGVITYHYKLAHWDDFCLVPELEHAPKWDGADPADTVTRLLAAARGEERVSQGPSSE